jgi:exosortase A-associated hydrolase 2
MTERPFYLEHAGRKLYAVLHSPDTRANAAVVFCHPFAEEKRCSHLAFVHAAHELCREGFHCLRFDMTGCGDSEGEFAQATVETWLDDLDAAVEYVARSLPDARIGLLGLRLGGALAALLAERRRDIEFLVLWEPIVSGANYVAMNLRRSLMRKMLTQGEEFQGAERAEGGVIDFDGWLVSSALREGIESLDLLEEDRRFPGNVLIVRISPHGTVQRELEALAEAYRSGQARCLLTEAVSEPIWSTVGLVHTDLLVAETAGWARRLLAVG